MSAATGGPMVDITCSDCGQTRNIRFQKQRRSDRCRHCNAVRNGRLGGLHIKLPREERERRVRLGRQLTSRGYVLVKRPDHPNARKDGYILEHRVMLEEKIGRLLLPSEQVHHINAIRDDNRQENLELWVISQPAGRRATDPHCVTCTCN